MRQKEYRNVRIGDITIFENVDELNLNKEVQGPRIIEGFGLFNSRIKDLLFQWYLNATQIKFTVELMNTEIEIEGCVHHYCSTGDYDNLVIREVEEVVHIGPPYPFNSQRIGVIEDYGAL
tara:strand:+ start:13459 stop:13818 length:360 start_codon:yes stop_codon:yes gene_type:complete